MVKTRRPMGERVKALVAKILAKEEPLALETATGAPLYHAVQPPSTVTTAPLM